MMTTRLVAAVGSRRRCPSSRLSNSSTSSPFFFFFFFLVSSLFVGVASADAVFNSSASLPGIHLPDHLGFNTGIVSTACGHSTPVPKATVAPQEKEEEEEIDVDHEEKLVPLKLRLNHHRPSQQQPLVAVDSAKRDLSRIHTLHRRISEKKNLNSISRRRTMTSSSRRSILELQQSTNTNGNSNIQGLMATLESGVSQGSGEYFLDVFVGTPPRHFSLILDTGSDLNWIQCIPCHDCFHQTGPHYDPSHSSSYRNITCADHRCALVSSPDDPPRPCRAANQSCPYFYWYGDQSNTTGDLASEVFAVNLTAPNQNRRHLVRDVVFGCGHWNRGLFHGAAGLLGLGRGPLSFTSQLRSIYGHAAFSYCLVDRNSNGSVSSKLFLGEDKTLMGHPELNFTSFVVSGEENPADTFYYVGIKSIVVGDEMLPIPTQTWELPGGGTIIDSGTTLSYFAEPAYGMIRDAFVRQVGDKYPLVKGFPVLDPCYNISGVEGAGVVDVPDFKIAFQDGAVWNFPAENYFIRLEAEEVVCLAMLPTPRSSSSLSILGNYQQQNFHVLYDLNRSRLGFAPMDCAQL